MNRMDEQVVSTINSALYFMSRDPYEKPEPRPWQYVQMEYERVGMAPPFSLPDFDTVEDAQIWMCLDGQYNTRVREKAYRPAV